MASSNIASSLPTEAVAGLASIRRRLDDVQSYQIPRLRDAQSASFLSEYEAEVRDALDTIGNAVQELSLSADEYDRPAEVRAVREASGEISAEYNKVRQASRTALLHARRSITAAQEALAREELVLGAQRAAKEKGQGNRSADDKLITASQDVTDALRRTTALMSQELDKSAFSAKMLDESSSTLQSISGEYTSFSSLLSSSRHLLSTMERADILDRLMVLAALTFFLLVVAYILKQRVFDKGLSLIGFFWRLGGLRKGRSVADVKQKLELASQAAKATNWALEEAKSQTSTSLKDAAQLVATSVATAAAAALSHTPTPAAETIVFVNEDEEIAAFDPSADEEQGEGEEREMEEAPEEQEEAPEPDRARTRQNTRPTVVHSEL